MPTTLPARPSEAGHTLSEQFLTLVCANKQLLQAEFEAGWTSPPARGSSRDRPAEHQSCSARPGG